MNTIRKDLEWLADLPRPNNEGPKLMLILALAILAAALWIHGCAHCN